MEGREGGRVEGRREKENQPDGPALIIPVSTLSSIVQVNIYCFCVFLNISSCRDHKLRLFDLFIHFNKPYLVSYFYLESTNLGIAHKSEQPTLPTCEVFICLPSIQTWEHIQVVCLAQYAVLWQQSQGFMRAQVSILQLGICQMLL